MEDDPLTRAEEQMIEHELDLLRRLYAKAGTHLGPDPDEWPNPDELKAAIMDDPEAAELAERLAVINRFRLTNREED